MVPTSRSATNVVSAGHAQDTPEDNKSRPSPFQATSAGLVRLGNVLIKLLVLSIVGIQLTLTRMIARIFRRLRRALFTFPTTGGWLDTATVTLLFGCIAVIVGFITGLLQLPLPTEFSRETLTPQTLLAAAVPDNLLNFAGAAFFVPVLVEELLFRALLLPRREERLPLWRKWSWAALALGAFVAWYPFISTQYFFTAAQPVVSQNSVLILLTLLGLGCTVLYRRTGSIWTAVIFHWLALVGWKLLGGFHWLS